MHLSPSTQVLCDYIVCIDFLLSSFLSTVTGITTPPIYYDSHNATPHGVVARELHVLFLKGKRHLPLEVHGQVSKSQT